MATLGTMFKKIYGEALAPYGFKKIKGKQPYFVRFVKEEILHIITYREEFSYKSNHKAFVILFGVATIYRKEIALEESIEFSSDWLDELFIIPSKEEKFASYNDVIPFRFEYELSEERLMCNEIKKAFELTEKFALSILNEIDSLEKCVTYFYKYKPGLMRLYADDRYVLRYFGGRHNEGLLCTLVYGKERCNEYKNILIEKLEEENKRELEYINNGRSGLTLEEYRNVVNEKKEQIEEFISSFNALVGDINWKQKVDNELCLRKENNIAILKKCEIIESEVL